jgi:CHASE2 domain-containing sensor protein
VLRRPSVISVFILVALWNISIATNWPTRHLQEEGFWRDTIGGIRDINLHLQLRFYQALTRLRPDPYQPQSVSLVYIDDDTHWTTLYGDQPTNRAFLARVVTNAANPDTKAAVIGLDVELLSPRSFPEGTDAAFRSDDNDALLAAIQYASSKGVPVILGTVYAIKDDRRFDLPNIFSKSDLLAADPNRDCAQVRCPGFGFLNLPEDKREIPLTSEVPPANAPSSINSFALALARAFRGPIESKNYPILNPNNHPRESAIFGTFVSADQYPRISISGLANGDKSAMQACSNRIVLIGGHWHERQGYLGWVDQHLSPAGYISGLGLHANYVESLLQHKYTHEINIWINIVLDLIVGLIIYLSFEAFSAWWMSLLILLAVFFAPIIAAWLFLCLANVYLDFLLPIELYFLHLLYEVVEKHFCLKRHEAGQIPPIPETGSLGTTGGKLQ